MGMRMGTDDGNVWTISRSLLDPRVWVPFNHEGDATCFLQASTSLRRLKVWIAEHEDMTDLEWTKQDADNWTLDYR